MPRPSWRRYRITPSPCNGDGLHGKVELFAAVAAQRAEHIAGEALGVHPHQYVIFARHVAQHQRQVFLVIVVVVYRYNWNSPTWVGIRALATRLIPKLVHDKPLKKQP